MFIILIHVNLFEEIILNSFFHKNGLNYSFRLIPRASLLFWAICNILLELCVTMRQPLLTMWRFPTTYAWLAFLRIRLIVSLVVLKKNSKLFDVSIPRCKRVFVYPSTGHLSPGVHKLYTVLMLPPIFFPWVKSLKNGQAFIHSTSSFLFLILIYVIFFRMKFQFSFSFFFNRTIIRNRKSV